jgi:hypothetical protein
MADGGERRMVFDLRGRRRHVVKAVYAVLAVLMGASLFLVVGPVNIGGLLGNGGGAGSASAALDDQAANIERKLKKNPNDEALLLALTRVRISAGNTLVSIDPASGQQTVTPEARAEYQQAAASWSRYLKQAGDQPNPGVAQLAANALISLAQTASTTAESDADVKAAAQAQQIVAQTRPNLGTVSTLAIYEYFALDFEAGDRAAKQAEGLATSKSQAKSVKTQLASYRKRAKKFQKQQQAFAKAQKGQGKQELQTPLGGLSGGGAGTSSTLTP